MKRRRNILEQGDLLPVLLLLPSILVVFVVMFIPLLYGVFMSFYNYHMGSIDLKEDFISISNYVRLFKDKVFLKAVGNTLFHSRRHCRGFNTRYGDRSVASEPYGPVKEYSPSHLHHAAPGLAHYHRSDLEIHV